MTAPHVWGAQCGGKRSQQRTTAAPHASCTPNGSKNSRGRPQENTITAPYTECTVYGSKDSGDGPNIASQQRHTPAPPLAGDVPSTALLTQKFPNLSSAAANLWGATPRHQRGEACCTRILQGKPGYFSLRHNYTRRKTNISLQSCLKVMTVEL